MPQSTSPRWRSVIVEELRKKGVEQLDIPGYEKVLLDAIRELLTHERQNLSQGGFPIQQSTRRIVSALAEKLANADTIS